MKVFGIVEAYLRQWFKGIEINMIAPGIYQSSAIRWPWDKAKIKNLGIQVVIDLSGGFDTSMPWLKAYLYWPIKDIPELPNLRVLEDVARWGLRMRDGNWKVLTHCTAGYNRSGLVNARILTLMGITGKEAVKIVKVGRPGALSNRVFVDYLRSLPGGG